MTTSDRILATLTELAEESRTPEKMGRAYPGIEREVAELMPVHTQLKRLPRDISLSAPAKAALRAQLMANIRQAALEAETAPWWRKAVDAVTAALTPGAFTQALARPAAMALAVTMSFTAAGVTTVSAALETVPGDGLYSVKSAYEQAVLAVQISDEGRIETHFWRARLRLREVAQLYAAGNTQAAEGVAVKLQESLSSAEQTAEKSAGNVGLAGVLNHQSDRLEQDVRTAPAAVQQIVMAHTAAPAPVVPAPPVSQAVPPAAASQDPGAAPDQQAPAAAQVPPSEPMTQDTTGAGGRIPDTKVTAGEPVGAKQAPTNDPKLPIAAPDPNAIPAKSGDSAPPSGPVGAPVATKDQPVTIEPTKPEPVNTPADIPSKVEPPAAPQSGGFDPKPQATNDPSGGFDGGKSDGASSPAPGLGPKQ